MNVRFAFLGFLNLLVAASATSALFFSVEVHEEDSVLDEFVKRAMQGVAPRDTEAVVLAVSRAAFDRTNRVMRPEELPLYERLESCSFFNVASAVSLRRGGYGVVGQRDLGPCGTMTRVTVRALDRLGIVSRKLYLVDDPPFQEYGHTMLEFRARGRWLVLSPSDGAFVWRRHDGSIATLEEIRADSSIFAEIFQRYPNYPYRFSHTRHIRWEKLPYMLRTAFRVTLGEARYERALTPRVYDEPRLLLLLASLAAFGLFATGVVIVRRAWRSQLPPAPTSFATAGRDR